MHRQSEVGDQPGEQGTATLVDLQVHEARIELHDVRGQPHEAQRIRGLQAEQATADDDTRSTRRLVGDGLDGIQIIHGAVDEATVGVATGHRGHKRV
ncbi:Uncharacterised protein [Mycobacteroides abscessus subsp. bolletii]|nr:Uncharacterised protein [Mycobacteroides abscessus subsp. bolletii]